MRRGETPPEVVAEQMREARKQEIANVAAEARFNWDHANHVQFLAEEAKREPERWKTLLPEIEGQPLIDLGSGVDESIVEVAGFAKALGASRYTAVDLHAPRLKLATTKMLTKNWGEGSFVNQDMLLYLSSGEIQDDSANIMMNGMDTAILRAGFYKANSRYLTLLVEEIARVVGENHTVFGFWSPPVFDALKKWGLIMTIPMAAIWKY